MPKATHSSILGDSAGIESTCNVGDLGSIPGSERSPGEWKGYPLQNSGLENSMDCKVHGVTKSRTSTHACMLSRFRGVPLFSTLWTVSHQTPLSMRFSRQEYRSGLPCPSPGNLPNPGTEPVSLKSPARACEFFTTSATKKYRLPGSNQGVGGGEGRKWSGG